MLSFFRINDPYRLVFIFGLLLLLRLPLYWIGVPLLHPELQWRLIGEAMADGKHLYLDIWDDIGPFSAVAYQVLYSIAGTARWPYYAISVLLVLIQAGLFNQFLLRNKAYKENTYVPALCYMIFMNLSFDFVTLPPVLFSITFILLAINNIFRRIDNTIQDELFLHTGIYLGVAVLFYLPSFLFLFSTLLSLLLFTGSIPRRLLLLLFGFFITLALAYTYYFWLDGAVDFHNQFFRSLWTISKDFLVTAKGMLWIAGSGMLVLIVALLRIYSKARFANYQVKFQQVMFLNLLVGILVVAFSNTMAPFQLMIFVPPLAFFASHYLLEIRRRFWAEIIAPLMLAVVLAWAFILFSAPDVVTSSVTYETYFVEENKLPERYLGKKIWVIGADKSYYVQASLGTPFLNWELSKGVIGNQQYYENVEKVYKSLETHRPEVIVDLEGFMPGFLEKAPVFAEKYKAAGGNVYYELQE